MKTLMATLKDETQFFEEICRFSRIGLTISSSRDHILSFQQQLITMNALSLLDHLFIIPDPRQQWKIEHKLADILFLTIAVIIGGAEGCEGHRGFRT